MNILKILTFSDLFLSILLAVAGTMVSLKVIPQYKEKTGNAFTSYHQSISTKLTLGFLLLMSLEAVNYYYMIHIDPDAKFSEWHLMTLVSLITWLITFMGMTNVNDKLKKGKHDKLVKEWGTLSWTRSSLWIIKAGWLGTAILLNSLK